MNLLQTAGYALVGMVCFFILVMIGSYSLDRQAKVDCLKLQAQAQEFADSDIFYITAYEKEKCDRINININARVQ